MAMKTSKFLCYRTEIARQEVTEEAQKLFDLYNDPEVSEEKKEEVKAQLDLLIAKLEEKTETSRTLRRDEKA